MQQISIIVIDSEKQKLLKNEIKVSSNTKKKTIFQEFKLS